MVSKTLKLVFNIYNTQMSSKAKIWPRELVSKMRHSEEIKGSFPFGTSAGTIFKSPVSPGNAPLALPKSRVPSTFEPEFIGNLLNIDTIQYFIQEIKIYLERGCPSFPSPPLSAPRSSRMGWAGISRG